MTRLAWCTHPASGHSTPARAGNPQPSPRRPRGLPEPCAATSGTHGSKGAGARQRAPATRLRALTAVIDTSAQRADSALGSRANIEALGVDRGHRTLVITRKGGKVVTIPLAPRTARAIDLAVGERSDGPVFLAADGRRLDRHGAARVVRRVASRAGITKPVGPHTMRHAFITAALDAGVPLRDVQEAASHADPRTTMRYDNSWKLHQMGEPNRSFRELAA